MFGFEKEKIQLKSVEDYLRTQEILGSGSENGDRVRQGACHLRKGEIGHPPRGDHPRHSCGHDSRLLPDAGAATEVAKLKASQKEGDLKALRKQVADLTAKIDRSEKQIES